MKRNIAFTVICILLFSFSLSAIDISHGGTHYEPEINDRSRDVEGVLGFQLPNSLYGHIDIRSTWFYEDYTTPDFLYIAIEVQDLKYSSILTARYTVHWQFKGKEYAASFYNQFNGNYHITYIEAEQARPFEDIEMIFDSKYNLVTLMIPKTAIGKPMLGDTLTHTYATADLTLWGLGLSKIAEDVAPDILYGKNYNIQF